VQLGQTVKGQGRGIENGSALLVLSCLVSIIPVPCVLDGFTP